MGHAAPPTASPADPSARFLAELENLWTLLRVYGTEHPAFQRCASAAAGALTRQLRVSVSPEGLTVGKSVLNDATLRAFAHRLKSMGLVGLVVDPGMTPAAITALVQSLNEADRSHLSGAAVVEKLAAASQRRVTAIPLRLAGLKLTEGVVDEPAEGNPNTTVWRNLFSAACYGSDGSDPGELAASFEEALTSVGSPAQWEAMVGVWVRQLSAAGARDAGAADLPAITEGQGRARSQGNRSPGSNTLDAAAAFLGALSPHLSRRLLAETFDREAAPQNVVIALADRLPKGIVLGALASVDRGNGQPSAAALALLRKMASNLGAAGANADTQPRTTAEMVEIAASLERLLGSEKEEGFVPETYLSQRQELSRHAVGPVAGLVQYPDASATARHAAKLAFQILSTPDSSTGDYASALGYVRNRTGDWIKGGDFVTAAEGIALGKALANHWDRAVSKLALDLVAHAVVVEDIVDGSGRSKDRAGAAEGIAQLLRQLDGSALGRALLSLKPSPGGGHEAVFDAFRRVLPALGEEDARGLCKTFHDATPPPALLSVISSLTAADAVKAVAGIAPHAASATRTAIVHAIFRHDFRWPLPLTGQLLKDDSAEIRRLAMMKLVSDADLATAARIFREAINRHGPYEPDVALGLAELLHRHRRHGEVRAAFRQWTWSGRRWAALFSLSLVDRRSAA